MFVFFFYRFESRVCGWFVSLYASNVFQKFVDKTVFRITYTVIVLSKSVWYMASFFQNQASKNRENFQT